MTTNQPRTKYSPDKVMIRQVRGLRRIGDDLMTVFRHGIRDQLSDLREGRQPPQHDTDDFLDRYAAVAFVMPVLRAFATELALKAISCKRHGHHARGHDLRKLYDGLDAEVQWLAEMTARIDHLRPIRDTLEEHKDDFVNWRYVRDATTLNTNCEDLDKALGILLDIYEVV